MTRIDASEFPKGTLAAAGQVALVAASADGGDSNSGNANRKMRITAYADALTDAAPQTGDVLTRDDGTRLTASELAETVHDALALAHRFDADAARADALADYCRARDEIRDRLSREAAREEMPEPANGGRAE